MTDYINEEVIPGGFIKLIEVRGSDDFIAYCAGQTYQKKPKNTESVLKKLMRENALTPFEQASMVFSVKAPQCVLFHWRTHRMATFNAQSRRVTRVKDENLYVPDNTEISESLKDHYAKSIVLYNEAIDRGVNKDVARFFLPGYSVFYDFIVTMNLSSLMNFFVLRLDDRAQYEIRQYAFKAYEYFKKEFPKTNKAFCTSYPRKHCMNID